MQRKIRLMLILYNILLILTLIIGGPFWILIIFKKKYRLGIPRKLCLYSTPLTSKKVILIHAVSVGEVNAALPFIETYLRQKPQTTLLITCSTFTGYHNALSKCPQCLVEYLPLDFFWTVKRFFNLYSIEKIFILETELWPNFIHKAASKNIPVYLVNGRLSDHSFPRYTWLKPLFKTCFDKITFFFCQTSLDAKRFKVLGVPSSKILVTGNIKFDSALQTYHKALSHSSSHYYKPYAEKNPQIWLAGSTQEDENIPCLKIFLQLKEIIPSLQFILVPRKPETLPSALQFLKENKIAYTLRSSFKPGNGIESLFIIDTIGELFDLYQFASVVFIGKTLTENRGGQNPLEPAAWSKAILMGPAYENFRTIAEEMLHANALEIVSDWNHLKERIHILLTHPEIQKSLGEKARQYVEKNARASETIMEKI